MKIKNVLPYIAAMVISLTLLSCDNDNKIVNPEPVVQLDSQRFIWTIQEVPDNIWRRSIIMTDTDEVFGIQWSPENQNPNVFRIKSWKIESFYFPDNISPIQVVGLGSNDVYVICSDTVPGRKMQPHIEKWNGNGFTNLNIPIIQQNGYLGSRIGNFIAKTGEIYMTSAYHNMFIYDGAKIYDIPGPTDSAYVQKIFIDKKNSLKCYTEYPIDDSLGPTTIYSFYEYDGNRWNDVYKLVSKYENPCYVEIFNSFVGVIYVQGIYELTETNNLELRLLNNTPYYSFAFPINGISFDEFLSLGGTISKSNINKGLKDGVFAVIHWNGIRASIEFHLLNFIYPTSIRYCKGYYCMIKAGNWNNNLLYIGRPKNIEQKNQDNSVSKNKNY